MNSERSLRPLPIRPRPQRGQTAESYVRALARANHLRPSYLRLVLTDPTGSHGPIQPRKLAAVCGRELPALLRALPDLDRPPARPAQPRYTAERIRRNQQRKHELFTQIRRDADAGMSARSLERKYHVGNRTVRQAIASPTPPPRKKTHRAPTVLNEVLPHIQAMLEEQPDLPVHQIWARLTDEHDLSAPYGAIRLYVAGSRPSSRRSHRRQS